MPVEQLMLTPNHLTQSILLWPNANLKSRLFRLVAHTDGTVSSSPNKSCSMARSAVRIKETMVACMPSARPTSMAWKTSHT